jgi:hypothetical protein
MRKIEGKTLKVVIQVSRVVDFLVEVYLLLVLQLLSDSRLLFRFALNSLLFLMNKFFFCNFHFILVNLKILAISDLPSWRDLVRCNDWGVSCWRRIPDRWVVHCRSARVLLRSRSKCALVWGRWHRGVPSLEACRSCFELPGWRRYFSAFFNLN